MTQVDSEVNVPEVPRTVADIDPSALRVNVQRQVGAFALNIAFDTAFRSAPDEAISATLRRSAGIAALFGASGSGKTLTLRAIAGLLRPDSGRISLGKRILFDSAQSVHVPARERDIGYVFQQYALFPHLSVMDNVGYGIRMLSRADRETRSTEVLDLVGMRSYADRRPHELSGGQQQRVALARALGPRPSLLLLDEPFAALDTPLRRRLGDELRELQRGTAVSMVLVTHDQSEAERLADVVIHVENGVVAQTWLNSGRSTTAARE